jgi:hypothetical protein
MEKETQDKSTVTSFSSRPAAAASSAMEFIYPNFEKGDDAYLT